MALTFRKTRLFRGTVFLSPPVVSREALYTGVEDAEIVALQRSTLEELWRIPAERFVVTHATDTRVILQSHAADVCRGVDQNGRSVWTLEAWPFPPSRLWRGGLLLAKPSLRVVDIETGHVRDDRPVPVSDLDSLAPVDGVLLLTRQEQHAEDSFLAYDFVSNRTRWQRDLLGRLQSRFDLTEDLVFLAAATSLQESFIAYCTNHVFGVRTDDGEPLWHCPVHAAMTACEADGKLYTWIGQGRARNRLLCLDQRTGETTYEKGLDAHGPDFSSAHRVSLPAGDSGRLVFTSRNGLVAVFKKTDGSLLGWHKHKAELFAPVLADDKIYVSTADGHLLAFEAPQA